MTFTSFYPCTLKLKVKLCPVVIQLTYVDKCTYFYYVTNYTYFFTCTCNVSRTIQCNIFNF